MPPKNIHPLAKDDDQSAVDGDPTRPAPILVENTYDGKIEFNFAGIGGKDCKTIEDEYRLMQATPELYCLRACHKIGYYL